MTITLTVPDIPESVADRLRARAAANNRSIEEEARTILSDAIGKSLDGPALLALVQELFGPEINGNELVLPSRTENVRSPPAFGDET